MTKRELKPYRKAILELELTARKGIRSRDFYPAFSKVKEGLDQAMPEELKEKAITLIKALEELEIVYQTKEFKQERTFEDSNSIWEVNNNLGRKARAIKSQ